MKKYKSRLFICFLIAIGLVFSLLAFEAKSQVNYITSGYYQMIYEADWYSLNKNYDSAFFYYQKAAKIAPMLNQSTYYEQEKYASLLIKKGKLKKGFAQLSDLIQKNRTTFTNFCDFYLSDVDTTKFIKNSQWRRLHNIVPDKTDSLTIAICKTMHDNEERRQNLTRQKEMGESSWKEVRKLDNENFLLLYDLLQKRHFPRVDDVGFDNIELLENLSTIVLHISDYRDYLRDVMLENVEKGYCSPEFFAGMFDRANFQLSTKFPLWSYYRFYDNTKNEAIFDIENLDNRRLKIGLPTLEYQQKRHQFFINKFKEMGFATYGDE